MPIVLWIVQALLALLFVFGGTMKLITPIDVLTAQVPLPALLIQFVGVAETLGGLGLILPGLLRIRPQLVTLAALELIHIMLAAVVITLALGQGVAALMPAVVGVLLAFVAYGRTRIAPHPPVARRTSLQPAHHVL